MINLIIKIKNNKVNNIVNICIFLSLLLFVREKQI